MVIVKPIFFLTFTRIFICLKLEKFLFFNSSLLWFLFPPSHRPYQCQICQARFVGMDGLNKHQKKSCESTSSRAKALRVREVAKKCTGRTIQTGGGVKGLQLRKNKKKIKILKKPGGGGEYQENPVATLITRRFCLGGTLSV